MRSRACEGFQSCRLRLVALLVGLAGVCPPTAFGQTNYFYGGGTRTWSNTLAWWQNYQATLQSLAAPGANDTAIFNTSGSNAAGSVLFTSDASVSRLLVLQTATGGLTLSSTGGDRTLTLGSGGIRVQPGNTSALTIGNATAGRRLNVTLDGSQEWRVAGGNVTISNTVTGNAASGASQTLLITNAAAVTTSALANGAGTLNLWLNNTGAVALASPSALTGTLTLQSLAAPTSTRSGLAAVTLSSLGSLQMAGGAIQANVSLNPSGTIQMLGGASTFNTSTVISNAGTFARAIGGGILGLPSQTTSGATVSTVGGVIPWAVGGNSDFQYITITSGSLVRFTSTGASGNDVNQITSGTGNWSAGGGTLASDKSANSLVFRGTINLSNFSLSLNALADNGGAGTSITADPGGFLGVGAGGLSKELVFIARGGSNVISAPVRESEAGGWLTMGVNGGNSGFAAGSFTLSGSNSHSGGTSIVSRGLNLNNAYALGSGTFRIGGNGIVLDNTTAAPLTIATNNLHEWNSDFSFGGTQDLNLGTGTVSLGTWAGSLRTVTVNAGNLTVGGRIVDGTHADLPTTGLAKDGPGTLILTGSNGYTGVTEAWGGELRFANRNALYGGGTANWVPANFTTGTLAVISVSVGDQPGAFTAADLDILDGAVGGPVGGYLGIDTTGVTSGTYTYGTNISAPAGDRVLGIAKTGVGTLVLSGSNSFTGGVLAREGRLLVTNANQVGPGTLVAAGGLLDMSGLTVSNTFSIISGTIANTSVDAAKFTAAVTGPGVFSGTLTGAGANGNWTKSGTGTLVLTAANTYSGTTTLSGGLLSISTDNNLGSTSRLVFNGGGLQVTGTSVTSLNAAWAPAFTAAQPVTFDIADPANAFTVSQPLNQTAGGLTKSGSGTLLLTGNNTYTGATTITGGTLRMGASNTAAIGAGTVLTTSGGVLDLNGNSISRSGLVTIAGGGVTGGTLTFTGSNVSGQSGVVSADLIGTGTFGLTKSGAGVLELSGTNTYSGTTAVSAGILTVNSTDSLPGWNAGQFSVAGGAALVFGSGFANADVATVSGTGTFSANSSLGFDTSGANRTYSTVIGNAGANARGLVKLGSGTLVLSASNTFTGVTAVGYAGGPNSGVMQLASTGFVSSTVTIFGGTFDTAGQNRSITTLTLGGGGAGSAAGLQTGSGTVTLAGNVTFTATNNPDGATIGGNLSLGGATRTVTVNDSTAAVGDLTISAVISEVSTAGLTKSGSGTLALTGQNTFTGKVAVNEGTVQIDSVVASTGVASPLGRNSTIDLGTAWRSGTLRWMGASSGTTNLVLNLSGTSGGGSIDAAGGGALTISGGVTSSNTTAKVFTLTGASTAGNTIGVVSGTNLSVVKDGPGRWRLTGTSSFDGTLTVKNGTLVAAATSGESGSGVFGTQNPIVGDTTPGATGTAALLLEAGFTINRNVTVASGVGVSQSVLVGGASESGTATFGSNKNLNIGRDVALVARPGGTLLFSNYWMAGSGSGTPTANVAIGADGFTGAVRLLTSGTLATSGSIGVRYGTAVLGATTILDGVGTLAIDAGATLAGVGTVAGPLGGAGLVAPGNSPGVLTAEAVDPSQGLAWAFEFTGATPDYTNPAASVNDVLRLTGTAPFTAGLTSGNVVGIYLSGSATGNVGDVYTGGFFSDSDVGAFAAFQSLVSSGSYVAYYQSGTGSYTYNGQNYALLSDLGRQLQVGVATGQSATFSGTTSTVTIGQVTTFTVVVPEPAAIALAGLGAAIAAWTLRRRRRPV